MTAALLAVLIAGPAAAGTLVQETLEHGGRARTYAVYVPSAPLQGLPAVFALHGGGGKGLQLRAHISERFDRLAEREGFLVVYPDGVDKSWNDGRDNDRPAARQHVDDVGFLGALADRLVKERGADPRRLYAVGISNGGFMSHALACRDAARWAAVAPVAASLPLEAESPCRPARPVPVLMVNGTEDGLIGWDLNEVRLLWKRMGRKRTVPETVSAWTVLDGCKGEPAREDLPDADPKDGTRWSLSAWRDCAAGSEVLLYKVDGGGHTWPRAGIYLPRVVGRTSQDVDFEALAWAFFKRHPLPEPTK